MKSWPGIFAAVIVGLVTSGSLMAVAWRAETWSGFGTTEWAAIRFTIFQALISACISVGFAIPVARALSRRQFWGRRALITLLGAPFILPVIVAVLGLLAVFGRNGLISGALGFVGLPPMQIYGLHGVVLAHVFFNLPLAVRLILHGWIAIPGERFRLAASLGFTSADVARTLERPMLREILPGAFMVIFVICTTSFAVALALGGGPKATTVELAIYQAFRFEFDLGKASLLALTQFTICGVAAGLMLWVRVPTTFGPGLDRVVHRPDARSRTVQLIDGFWIGLATSFVVLPLAMIALRGFSGILDLPFSVFFAAFRSIIMALSVAGLTLCLSMPIAISIWTLRQHRMVSSFLEGVSYLAIAASPMVIGTGLFLVLFLFTDPVQWALVLTVGVNTMMSLPFALRALAPGVARVENQFGKLADSVGLLGWARLRHLYIPRLRRELGFSAGLAAALSMGDLGVIALFSDPDRATLPLMLYRLMSAYRMNEAAGAALLLLALSLALFWVFDRGGRGNADA